MSKLTYTCPICKQKTFEKSHFDGKTKRFITLNCNHTVVESKIEVSKLNQIELVDGRQLYPFQVDGVRFAEASNFKCLITDEMGLGKTIQAVGSVALHYHDLKPILMIVKASLTYQWLKEFYSGTGQIAQILDAKTEPIKGLGAYICSFDAIPPRAKKDGSLSDGLLPKIQKLGIKTIIIDEVQMMKNHSAARTNAIRDIARATHEEKPQYLPISNEKQARIKTLASDLMKMHGLKGFSFQFGNLPTKILGQTKCRTDKQGSVIGDIVLNNSFVSSSNEDQIIEIILHEIAHALTPGAGHAPLWQEIAKEIGSVGTATYAWCNGTVELKETETVPTVKHIIGLSGTPIKNSAIEYFPILNLLRPEIFYARDPFISRWVDQYWDGTKYRAGGIDPSRLEEFRSVTKDFIIRRTRDEVLPDLPKIQRDFKFYPMSDEVTKAYNKKVKVLSDFLDENETQINSFKSQGELIGHLQVLRHITGIAKVEPVIEYVQEYLEGENGHSKITIFHHHKDVGEILYRKLSELYPEKVIRMTSDNDASVRTEKIEQFRTQAQILIAPTLACGEGINLQFCSHAILMEREWNPANEEQAEGRFSRIGSTASSVLINYPTATGTIDEFFAELVEQKRQAVTQTLDGKAQDWNESIIMKELAQIVVKKWRMK